MSERSHLMIIYNVTVKVAPSVKEEWLEWMKNTHIPEVLATGLFHSYRICHLLEQDESDGPTFAIQYFTDSMENYHSYVKEHASLLRDKTTALFKDKLVAFRTVMQVVS